MSREERSVWRKDLRNEFEYQLLQPNTEVTKGILALDIDGTLTTGEEDFEIATKEYLEKMVGNGWHLIFLTGRILSFASPLLSSFSVPFDF